MNKWITYTSVSHPTEPANYTSSLTIGASDIVDLETQSTKIL
jgi:hypothetical protein